MYGYTANSRDITTLDHFKHLGDSRRKQCQAGFNTAHFQMIKSLGNLVIRLYQDDEALKGLAPASYIYIFHYLY